MTLEATVGDDSGKHKLLRSTLLLYIKSFIVSNIIGNHRSFLYIEVKQMSNYLVAQV